MADFDLSSLAGRQMRENVRRLPRRRRPSLVSGEVTAVMGPLSQLEGVMAEGLAVRAPPMAGLSRGEWTPAPRCTRPWRPLGYTVEDAVAAGVADGRIEAILARHGLTLRPPEWSGSRPGSGRSRRAREAVAGHALCQPRPLSHRLTNGRALRLAPTGETTMNLTDQRDIRAPREAVWAGITDPGTLKQCIPGCQEMTGSVEEGFEAVVVQKVGPVKATFRGHVDLLDVVEGESCTLRGEGKGGPAGFAKGEARVTLSEIEMDDGSGGTRLAYEVDAKVGGKLAQLGGRVVDGVAGRMADQFFDRFKEVVEGPSEQAPPAGAPASAPASAGVSAEPAPAPVAAEAAPEGEPEKGWLRRMISRDKTVET